MLELLKIVFYQPIFNLLIFLYNNVPAQDLGLAIILLTIIVRLVFLPLSRKSIKSQKALQELQPKIEEIKKEYKNDREKMGKAMMDLYKDNKVNPLSSCLPLLIQLPFFISIVEIFRRGLGEESLELVYSFIQKPEIIDTMAFGFLDLSSPNIILAIFAGIASFFQMKMMLSRKPETKPEEGKEESMAVTINKQMVYFMPLLIVFIGATLPAAFTLYLLVFNITMVIQQLYMFRKDDDKKDDDKDNPGKDRKKGEVIEGEVVK